jgi:shikimate dehydrogenase
MTDNLQLGLIGDTIAASRAPLLHRLAGAQHGVDLRYDLIFPKALGQDLPQILPQCREDGYRGDITYPYKEQMAARGATALLNETSVGMVGQDGAPLPA